MPLKVVEISDLRDFTREFVTNRGLSNMDPHNQDLSEGVNLGNSDGTSGGSEYTYGHYCHIAEQYLWWQITETKDSGTLLRTLYPAIYAHDALCRDTDKGWWIPHTYQPNFGSITGRSFHFGGTAKRRFIIGQPNLDTGEQVFYYYGDLSGSPNSAPETYVIGWHSFNVLDGSRDQWNVNIYPNLNAGLDSTSGGAATGATAGYWEANNGVNGNQDEYCPIIFEGITDTTGGMPGETHPSAGMLRGGTSHPEGLMLIRARVSNFNGDGTSNDLGTRMIWVDLDTGLAVGILGLPSIVNSQSSNPFHENSINLRQFDWQRWQFVPDPGSSFAQPKGELHAFLAEDSRFELHDQSVEVAGETPFTSTVNRQYVSVWDFNPFNVTGGTVRVHNRRRFVGILDTPCEPIQDGGVSLDAFGTTHVRRSPSIYYHPPSRSYINVQSSFENANNAGTDEPAAGASRIIRWARQTQVDKVSHPIPIGEPRANGRITIRSKITNDFDQPIAGETVYFRLNRQSTRDEQFDGTTQAGTNYVVANAVIDDDASLEVYEGAGIDDGGVLLELGVDYTVSSYTTGTLAPVGSWPTDTVSVRYRHRSVPLTTDVPATLLNASAVSNANGVVSAQVQFGEFSEGELIGFEADSEAFS